MQILKYIACAYSLMGHIKIDHDKSLVLGEALVSDTLIRPHPEQ